MLYLDRKIGESLIIELPDKRLVKVMFLSNDRGNIRLGFDAPKPIPIFRAEIMEQPVRPERT